MNSLKQILTILFILSVSVAAYAILQVESGSTYWSRRQTITASTSALITESAADSTPALFPAGESKYHQLRLVITTADSAASCCYVGEDAATVSGLEVTDEVGGEYGVGPRGGSCHQIDGLGIAYEEQPSRKNYRTLGVISHRTGLCSTAHSSGGESLYAPCDTDADCTNYGAGSCLSSPGFRVQSAGVFLRCAAPAAGNAVVSVVRKKLGEDL